MKETFYPSMRSNNIVIQDFENETLIYDLKENKALCLNHSAAQIWRLCDGKTSVPEIREKLTKSQSEIDEDFVWLALEQLANKNLLASTEAIDEHFVVNSRREILKKVGFTSVLTLPIVSSVIAPTAATAQSCSALQSSCSTSQDCCSGNCQSGSLPMRCCNPGVTDNFAPLTTIGCGADTPACNALSTVGTCCSGIAEVTTNATSCAPGTFRCACSSTVV